WSVLLCQIFLCVSSLLSGGLFCRLICSCFVCCRFIRSSFFFCPLLHLLLCWELFISGLNLFFRAVHIRNHIPGILILRAISLCITNRFVLVVYSHPFYHRINII